jgi:hypothetical protein
LESPLYTPVILSVCVLEVVLLLLLPPPHPAMPAAMQPNSTMPAQAYRSRFAVGTRRRLSRNSVSSKHATIHIGPTGRLGVCPGAGSGANWDSVVINVAVQDPGVVLVPAVGLHVAGLPTALPLFMNCTVPVTPAPLFPVPVTVAVKVTLPPEVIEVELEVTAVVVAIVPPAPTEKLVVPVDPA